MVTQGELSEYARLNAEIKAGEERLNEMRQRFIEATEKGEAVEAGVRGLKVTPYDKTSTAYAKVVDSICEKHPGLAGAIANIVKKFTKLVTAHRVEVMVQG